MNHSPSRPVKQPHSTRSAALEGAKFEAQSKTRLLKQKTAEASEKAVNAAKNFVETAPRKLERVAEDIEEFIDDLPEMIDNTYEDLRTFVKAFPGKTHEEYVRAMAAYRKAQLYASQTPRALQAAGRSFRDSMRAPPIDVAMMSEGLGRTRSVRGGKGT